MPGFWWRQAIIWSGNVGANKKPEHSCIRIPNYPSVRFLAWVKIHCTWGATHLARLLVLPKPYISLTLQLVFVDCTVGDI